MKNYMKKIIIAGFAFILLFTGVKSALASGPFNGQSGDCPSIAIGNYTTGVGIGDGQWNCWTRQSVSALAGETINVALFYHNNTSSPLTNVEASLSQSSSGPAYNYSFTGTMYSDQGSTTLGTVNLSLNSNQTLTYSSAHWMKDKYAIDSDTDSGMLYGQDGSVMKNGGRIKLGSVPSGWTDYGYIVVVFKVGNAVDNICRDTSAINYLAHEKCIYPQIRCLDTSATNYLAYSSCVYPQVRCLDTSASNYLSYSSCIYPQIRCLDTTATNYLAYSSCIYPQVRCLDTSASNYLAYSSCIYPQIRCLDTTATNYLAYSACTYRQVYVNKNVVTTVATNITKNEAQVNGYITNSTYYNANTYFEYGTTVNLGSRTNAKSTIGNSNMSDYLTGLAPNTIYFYRAVGEGPDGVSKGSIEIFKTLSDVAPKPIIIQGTTVVGTASPIMLKISNKYELIGEGDLIDYIVNYKNIGKQLLTHPMVQVVLPSNVTLVNSSRGTYSVDTHTLSAQVEDLKAGDEGVIFLQGRVDSIPLNNSQIATTAILVYTTPNGTQENAMAYVINVPKTVAVVAGDNNSVLGGNAFFAGLLSLGFIGWLILILVILLIILIARSYSNRKTTQDTITHTTTH
ncbi:TPA: hypothetical protein DEP30_00510 [Candidatus Nomurabacteria bacterium]|nr:MAG: hypothetical protein US21_C0005G0083 [Candidatus Nomurabacteria bacterium GW2011_GWB1_36_6]HAS69757.1 hypothetical protein [Candidatus Nomurabacteria bacterium]HCB21492.1 hypothetical protein [Candidatus Nomurabacteria bacterium]